MKSKKVTAYKSLKCVYLCVGEENENSKEFYLLVWKKGEGKYTKCPDVGNDYYFILKL